MSDPRLTRRAFLAGMGAAGATLLAACMNVLPSPSSSQTPSSAAASPSPSVPPTTPGETILPEVSLRAKIGQMLLVGFRGTDEASSAAVLSDIADRHLGGVVLFGVDQPTGSAVRNIVSPEQLAALTATLQEAAESTSVPARLLIAVDQEGGQVARLGPDHGFPPTQSAAELGAQDDARATRLAGRGIATTLRQAGINLNLAPVVDLNLNPDNPIIGALDRSFGADPDLVQRQAAAFIHGHHQVGVRTTLKHFPGHGSSAGDTHLGVVDVTDTWQPVELQPFRRLVRDGLADAILTAHVFNARLDPEHPATLSHPTITGILRRQTGWDGVVISDDMQMGAIRDAYGYPDAVRLAIEAGVDVLTIANQQVFEEGIVAQTIDLVAAMVEDRQITEARIDRSYRRIQALKQNLLAA